jgi:transposase InsO family protein
MLKLIWWAVIGLFRSRASLEAEIPTTAPQSPWQNGHVERLIGSIRRECLDHVVVFGERHLRHILLLYMTYYNSARTHLSLNKDAPIPRGVQAGGRILPTPILGGLHLLPPAALQQPLVLN